MTVTVDLEALASVSPHTSPSTDEVTLVRRYLEAAEANKPELRVFRMDDGLTYRWTAIDSRNGLIVAAATQAYNDPRDRDHNAEMVLGGGYRLDLQ